MNCPKCNTVLPPNSKFCSACGTPITPAPEVPEQPAPAVPEQPAPAMPEQPAPAAPEQPAPAAPEQPAPAAPQAPESAPKDFSAQYQQYQQAPQYPQYSQYQQVPQDQQLYGVAVKKKSKAPFIIIPIVSVLVIAGIVLGIIFGVRGCASGSHRLVDSYGVFIAEDEAIDVNDSEAQSKIEKHLKDNNIDSVMAYYNSYISSFGEYVYAVKGNTLLVEVRLKEGVSKEESDNIKSNLIRQSSDVDIAGDRQLYGVPNMVEVEALVDSSGKVIFSKIIK